MTTKLWELISSGANDELETFLEENSGAALVRSKDGRGPLFWAYEYSQAHAVALLVSQGAEISARDVNGNRPRDIVGLASAAAAKSTSAASDVVDDADDDDFDPFDEDDPAERSDSPVEVAATPLSKAEYANLFKQLTDKGCKECVGQGYGWSLQQQRCGGFANSKCS